MPNNFKINFFNLINESYNYEYSKEWVKDNFHIFLILILFYILLINFSKLFLKNKKIIFNNSINKILALWNLFLAVFSFIGFFRLTPIMFNSIERNGIITTYTQITELQTNQISGFWIFIWVLSKIPELFDTLFLILKGRPIRFMHWFHHSMSILFGTINFIGDNAYLVWVVWMNFFIHSIMYSYYMLTCFSFRFPKIIPQSLTTLQIIQVYLI
uniref:Elongation of very long chain fatty acids protein n=1 Tax=Meloidogyne enterolobii TaxID=390850 RepID=A0A6V7WMX3_MELEN|nr:unnamed protein product [Meloidogyne enterolobii]